LNYVNVCSAVAPNIEVIIFGELKLMTGVEVVDVEEGLKHTGEEEGAAFPATLL
jgi:hypothetical protein